MQMHYGTYAKHSPAGKIGSEAYGVMVFHLSNGYYYGDAYWVSPDWVESSKEIDSVATLCKMWWTIGNSPTLIMDLFIHYNICTKTKCVSLYHRFPGRRFGKHFWIFGQIPCTLSNNAYFPQWTRFWAI